LQKKKWENPAMLFILVADTLMIENNKMIKLFVVVVVVGISMTGA
jgi:hypothetical protein